MELWILRLRVWVSQGTTPRVDARKAVPEPEPQSSRFAPEPDAHKSTSRMAPASQVRNDC